MHEIELFADEGVLAGEGHKSLDEGPMLLSLVFRRSSYP